MIDICLALDASGSISNEQCREFLTEVKNIMDQYYVVNRIVVIIFCILKQVHTLIDNFTVY